MLMTTAPAPSQRTSPCTILEGDPPFKNDAAIELIASPCTILEGDPPFKTDAAVELIVKPSIRSAMAVGVDFTFPPIYEFSEPQGRFEFVSKLLKKDAEDSVDLKRKAVALNPLSSVFCSWAQPFGVGGAAVNELRTRAGIVAVRRHLMSALGH
jgi:hypothetical protein